jgi:hypothetical protein
MCGIFGLVSPNVKNSAELRAFMVALAYESSARGTDATGFAGYSDGEFAADKAAISSTHFVRRSKAWRNAMIGNALSIIGHTRAATSGSPKDNDNNHPFHSKRYSLVHNGGIWLHEQIAEQYGFQLETDCDSELILHFVNSEKALRDGILSAFEVLDSVGTMAVAVLDRSDRSVNLFRTKDSPCVALRVPRWNAVIFASTLEIFCKAALPFFGSMKALYENADTVLDRPDIPDYTHVKISADGEVTTESLNEPLTKRFGHGYRGRQLNWDLDDQMAIFSGLSPSKYQATNVKKKGEENQSSRSPGLNDETAIICKGCLTSIKTHICSVCSTDNSVEDRPVVPRDASRFIPPIRMVEGEIVVGSSEPAPAPSNSPPKPDIVSHAVYDRTMAMRAHQAIAKQATKKEVEIGDLMKIVPEQFIAGSPGQIAGLLMECRPPVADEDLSPNEVGTFFSYSHAPNEGKLDKWNGTSLMSIARMSEGEYLAYFQFVTGALEARIEAAGEAGLCW